uniref:SJCHGC08124 protein n=1 Tax=Schistosoma japonicum TaxID=6182 RepID=Q5DEC1_SCHJA|nr:SJCHGC08124 protein [Schistosoma japonicum]
MNRFRWISKLIHFINIMYTISFLHHQGIMADFLFRTPNNYLILPEWKFCPSCGLYFNFITASSTGLLLYTENNKTGQFFALTLLPNSRIKLELELRPPQYRITRAHTTVTLNYSEKRKTNTHVNTVSSHLSHRFSSTPSSDWHTVEISLYPMGIIQLMQ